MPGVLSRGLCASFYFLGHIKATAGLSSSPSSSFYADYTDYMTTMSDPKPLRVVCIGDVHGEWTTGRDDVELASLKPDLVLAVGDYANEKSAIPRALGALPLAKALLLGNHDAWRSAQTGRVGSELKECVSYNDSKLLLLRSVDALSAHDAAYRRLEFEEMDLCVVGARPLSWGGSSVSTGVWALLKALYQVTNREESIAATTDALLGARSPAIVLAHSGPTGLGADARSICGRDWMKPSCDFGDEDLRAALDTAKSCRADVPLVVFGHMHSQTRYGRRKMVHAGEEGTVFVNAAQVPRHRQSDGASHFTLVELDATRQVTRVSGLWSRQGVVVDEEILFKRDGKTPQEQPAVQQPTQHHPEAGEMC